MKKEEPTTEDIENMIENLDNANVPTENRILRFVCPHCGKVIELGGKK